MQIEERGEMRRAIERERERERETLTFSFVFASF